MLMYFNKIKRNYKMDIKGIIHIGGHYGEELQDYIDNGIQNIMVFEPLNGNFNVLSDKAANLNANIEGFQVALGAKKGTATMYVSDNESQSSSILEPAIHLTHHPHVKFPTTEEVEVDLLDEYDCKDYNFINMDVQGYELEVLKGATETLKQIKYVFNSGMCCIICLTDSMESSRYSFFSLILRMQSTISFAFSSIVYVS